MGRLYIYGIVASPMNRLQILSATIVLSASLLVVAAANADGGSVAPAASSDHSRGDADAKLLLIEYADLQCPFSKRFHPTMQETVDAYDGDVRWIYRHFPLSFYPEAMPAAKASECIATHAGNDAFWAFVDYIYKQEELPVDYAAWALKKGISKKTFDACLRSSDTKAAVQADIDDAEASGHVTGTPTLILVEAATGKTYDVINGAYPASEVARRIDAFLAGKPSPLDGRPEPSEPPTWETEPEPYEDLTENLPPVTAKDPLFGSRKAGVTIVEYGDIQCPFCKRAHTTMKALIRKNRGQVNWVFRHYPLAFHEHALSAAEASECVRELKGNAAFWTFIDKLYNRQASLSAGLASSIAKQLKVPAKDYNTCLTSDRHVKPIQAMMDAGTEAGVNGTPAFFVIDNRTDRIVPISGAVPEETFQDAIDGMLDQ